MAEKIVKTPGRNRKTPEEKAAAIDEKIAKLVAEKEAILRPIEMKKIIDEAASKGMTPDEIKEKLGL